MAKNLTKFQFDTNRQKREMLNEHRSILIWITGLSGAGKSTIANKLETKLHDEGMRTMLLDGDNVRSGLNADLGFSKKDREENIRRLGEMAKILMDAGNIVLASFISPLNENRETIKQIVGTKNYIEVYANTSIESCIQRDNKGLYAKAISGELTDFTGISAPYEPPVNPDFQISFEDAEYIKKLDEIIESIKAKISL